MTKSEILAMFTQKTDDGRPYMQKPMRQAGKLYATNGFMMVEVDDDPEIDASEFPTETPVDCCGIVDRAFDMVRSFEIIENVVSKPFTKEDAYVDAKGVQHGFSGFVLATLLTLPECDLGISPAGIPAVVPVPFKFKHGRGVVMQSRPLN